MQEPVTGTTSTCWNFFNKTKPSFLSSLRSTKAHRYTSGFNAIAQVTNLTTVTIAPQVPQVFIPFKVGQVVTSSVAMLLDTKIHEKGLHFILACIAMAQLIVVMILFFQKTSCSLDSREGLCSSLYVLDWIYTGLLTSTHITSEGSRLLFPSAQRQQQNLQQNQNQQNPQQPHQEEKQTMKV